INLPGDSSANRINGFPRDTARRDELRSSFIVYQEIVHFLGRDPSDAPHRPRESLLTHRPRAPQRASSLHPQTITMEQSR
ncbi:MAG: hypothetical protein ACLQNV_27860, partial [Steroidobacteraceae bacterium]